MKPKMGNKTRSDRTRLVVFAAAAGAALVLSGCGTSTAPFGKSITTPEVRGIVLGGQQPVAFINLQLYTVGTSGYGSAASPLGAAFQTTASGNFNYPAYTCPGSNPETFLLGTGGTPISGSPNPNLALMIGLGPCPAKYVPGCPWARIGRVVEFAAGGGLECGSQRRSGGAIAAVPDRVELQVDEGHGLLASQNNASDLRRRYGLAERGSGCATPTEDECRARCSGEYNQPGAIAPGLVAHLRFRRVRSGIELRLAIRLCGTRRLAVPRHGFVETVSLATPVAMGGVGAPAATAPCPADQCPRSRLPGVEEHDLPRGDGRVPFATVAVSVTSVPSATVVTELPPEVTVSVVVVAVVPKPKAGTQVTSAIIISLRQLLRVLLLIADPILFGPAWNGDWQSARPNSR